MLAKLFTAVAVTALAAAPVMAAPTSPVGKLSLSRAATVSKGKSKIRPAVLVGVLATAAIIGGAITLANSDNSPDSP